MIEAMKQALEALKDVGILTDREWQAVHKNKANELRQAIAELEKKEPVAWSCWQSCLNDDGTQTSPWVHRLSKFKPYESIINKDIVPLYTHPPQRTWVGLTDEEIRERWFAAEPTPDGRPASYNYARAIEAKLKERNL